MSEHLPAFRIEMGAPQRFRAAIAVIEALVTEVRFKLSKTKLTMSAIDPANVCIARLIVHADFCRRIDVTESCNINVNLHDLHRILERMQDHDTLKLTNHENKLRITFDDSKSERTYTLPCIEIADRDQKVPQLNLKAETRMPSKTFERTIYDADVLGETLTFTSKQGRFTISTKDDNHFSYESSYEGATKSTGEQRSKYSIEYLKKIADARTVGGEALIKHSTDYPLTVTFDTENLELLFVLAPRVDND